MPQIVPAVAAAVSWVSSAAAAASAAVVGWMAAPFAMALGEGAAIAMASGVLKVAATALGSYALNAVLAPKVGGGGSPTQFKADPQSPIRGVMGRFGTSGTQAHMRVWGKNNLMISYMVILSLGPIQGVEKFTANGLQVNFTGPNGLAANVEPYKDKMWMTYKNGLPTDGSLMPPPTGGTPTMEWTGNHKTSGYAGAFWTMQNNSKRASYEGGVPKPVWTLNGMLCYDPRLDSTQTEIGGSGPHRVDDWRTWTYSQNPQIHAINWALGHYKKLPAGIIDRNFLLAGIGAPITSLHLPSLVAGANVSDANGWKICGEWNTQDDKWNTFAAMLQAGGSAPIHVGAKIGIMTNAPRVPVATITDEDVTGNLNIKVMAPSRDRFNTIYPMYISEPNGWEYATAGAVTSTVYQAEDGGEERSKEMKYNFVGQSKQARELAAYDLANTRETMKLAFPAKPYLIGVRAGDAVNVDMPRRGIVGKFIVLARPLELGEGAISFELRSESDAKHAWALGQTDQPAPSPSLSPFDPSPTPPEGWVVTPRPPESGGTQQPGFIVVGEVPDGIGSVLFEVGSSTSGPWRQVYSGPPTTERVNIDNLAPLETYWVRVTYYSIDGVPSEPTVYGPYTAPDFVAKGEATFPDGTSPIWNFDELSDLPVPPSSENQTQAYVAETGKLYSWNPDTNAWEPMVADATIDDGTLTNAKFVSGLRAAGLGPTLPTLPNSAWPVGSQFVLTTDGKTYTNKGGVWNSDVLAEQISGEIASSQIAGIAAGKIIGQVINDQIAAGAIAATQLAAGAVTTPAIATGAITASKMFIGDTSNMFPDPTLSDMGIWSGDGVDLGLIQQSGTTVAQGSRYLIGINPDTVARGIIAGNMVCEPDTPYFFSIAMSFQGGSDTTTGDVVVDWYSLNASGVRTQLRTDIIGATSSGTPTRFSQTFTAPSEAREFRVRVRRNGGGTRRFNIYGPVIRRATTGELIVDGAILANHLSANSVTAGAIAAGTITSTHVASQSITASKLMIGDTSNMFPDPDLREPEAIFESFEERSFLRVASDTTFASAYYVRKFNPTSVNDGTIISRPIFIEPDRDYYFSSRAFVSGLTANITVEWYFINTNSGAPRTHRRTDYLVQNHSGGWTKFEKVLKSPSNANAVSIKYAASVSSSGDARFAEPVIRRAASGELIVDGAITTDKLAANSIVAGKVAAGAINGTHISAGAITTSKLAVGDYSNLVNDGFSDEAFWNTSPTNSIYQSLAVHNYKKSWRWSQERSGMSAYAYVGDVFSNHFAVEEEVDYYFGSGYRLTSNARGRYQLWVYWHDGQGTQISSPNIATITAAGTELKGVFGGVVKSPIGAATARFRIRVLADGDGNHVFGGYFFDPVARRAASGELIVDGAITATKIATNAVTADKIVAGAVTAAKINVTQLSAITSNLGAITGGSMNINNRFMVNSSGIVTIQSGTSGQRLVISNSLVQIYDSSNTLRLRMGLW